MGIFPRRLFLYTEKRLVLQAAYKFLTNFLNDDVLWNTALVNSLYQSQFIYFLRYLWGVIDAYFLKTREK